MEPTANPIQQVLDRTETITFDCYGTLIDWRAGIRSALRMGAPFLRGAKGVARTVVRDVFGCAIHPPPFFKRKGRGTRAGAVHVDNYE